MNNLIGKFKEHSAAGLFLAVLFLSMIYWFRSVDVYNQHFFDDGSIVFFYNLFRLLFVATIGWIIYSTGYFVVNWAASDTDLTSLTALECFVLRFGAGIGVWHIAMLVLGLMNLYYPWVVFPLCLLLLVFSAPHLESVFKQGCKSARHIRGIRLLPLLLPWLVIGALLLWIVVVYGLYPSGGHDYFTHYFHYYLSVIGQHGLAPNDVWYHYYYSKGAGLHFLGILLTDPLAPALMTFVCVIAAACALYSLTSRIAPSSLWPLLCVSIYLLYYILNPSGNGGEFQKIHEEVSALVVISIWTLLMARNLSGPVLRAIVLAQILVSIGMVILSQAISVFFLSYAAVMFIVSIVNKDSIATKNYLLLSFVIGFTAGLMFFLNYFATGLVSDQLLNIAWRYANIETLNAWGVLPNVMLVAWIRDNYAALVPAWNVGDVVIQGIVYTRANFLAFALISLSIPICYSLAIYLYCRLPKNKYYSVVLIASMAYIFTYIIRVIVDLPIFVIFAKHLGLTLIQSKIFSLLGLIALIGLLLHCYSAFSLPHRIDNDVKQTTRSFARYSLVNILWMLMVFVGLSIILGRGQDTSFYRFSGYFLPIMMLLFISAWSPISNIETNSRISLVIFKIIVPVIMFCGILDSWGGWRTKLHRVIETRINFMVGRYSIGYAYTKQDSGFAFGGIHPGTWSAVQHVPKGERVWSTTVVSYCMAPNCKVESVISYKFSSKLNEVLNGTAEEAKEILQAEGLNYFLYLSEFPLLDFMPYSALFQPDNLKKYFTIKWTDGSTYLLTWKTSQDETVSDEFVRSFTARKSEKEDSSFMFSKSIPYLNQFMVDIYARENNKNGFVDFPWRHSANL